ncbi:uncharacterized protein PHACADRAFT_264431 [Phanerochaete carnosa HHB-10118-sp]|uniref:Uncharacterized protein n=1 Tax=Phanerochaete carnosa (strain HHB-10118-sp) TaxID=650164 RepID=K5VT60_PHACS|nr:uncharacterized protein PHACADRAFT_264431 [Phanerochaete carnosa HHB-10118-sp]EKM49970.1 hypothetical protein PHACADRAFT_264431 [Phanerochaete carnosa HHB-10118-sp]
MWTELSFGPEGNGVCPLDACFLEADVADVKARVAGMSVEARSSYLAEQMTFLRRWRKHVFLFQGWYEARKETRGEELSSLRDSRYNSIVGKLEEMGWSEEFSGMSYSDNRQFARLSAVRQSRTLTERAWRNAAPSIMAFMEKVKAERLHRERIDKIEKRLRVFDRTLPKIYNYRPGEPAELDIALGIPALREVIDGPAGEQVDENSFDFLIEQKTLEAFTRRWKKERDIYLAGLIAKKIPDLNPDVDPLSLAVASSFSCNRCRVKACCPQVHYCKYSLPHKPEVEEGDAYGEAAIKVLSKQYWEPSAFVPNVDVLSSVIVRCGLDPERASAANLNNSRVRFACRTCNHNGVAVTVMTWYAACFHRGTGGSCKVTDLYVVDDEITKAVSEAEQSYIGRARGSSSEDVQMCSHCSQLTSWRETKEKTIEHVQLVHQIEQPLEGRDFWPINEIARIPEHHSAVIDLLPEELKGSLTYRESNALQKGNTVFFKFESSADRALPYGLLRDW